MEQADNPQLDLVLALFGRDSRLPAAAAATSGLPLRDALQGLGFVQRELLELQQASQAAYAARLDMALQFGPDAVPELSGAGRESAATLQIDWQSAPPAGSPSLGSSAANPPLADNRARRLQRIVRRVLSQSGIQRPG